ncbi:unnamed protein product [Chondrus crispus]|uniref:Uncharacterized protein n=1 Tax=Chondrus crispus TaxID=2769 RepID=R7QIW2_CHOCR|nr:unnamed protein product [Chondrus crispus]CDF37989.1 unnamed protein product [Chondrus crispus]|eukprot:XP_005717858.1 unnamed protein product [Chondrus crispus]
MLSDLKQMGKLTLVREYNREFSRWLLQIPSMTSAEQIFHYSQGLKTRTRIEVERAEPQSLQDAMKIADRLDSLFNSDKKKQYSRENNGKESVKVCTFSPYKKRTNTKRQALLLFNGEVQDATDNSRCTILVDSGCEEIVISKAYAEKLKLRKGNTNLSAELWERTLVPMERCCENLIIRIGEATITVRPYVVDWIAYDLILGKAWLSEANPLIDWKMNRMLLKQEERLITLDAEAHKHEEARLTYMLTSKQFLDGLLGEYRCVFPQDLPKGLPPKRSVEMRIDLEMDARPKTGPIYKLSRKELEEMKNQLEEALENGFIRPSISRWGSPVLFTPKKDVWDQVGGSKYFSTIDLRSGYHQIRLRDADIQKTAFRTRYGQYEYLVTPFGLTGAPGCFQTLMNNIFRPHLHKFVLVYLHDILIYSKTKEDHLNHLRTILQILKEHQLYGKLSKCKFLCHNLEYLGHIISENGIQVCSITPPLGLYFRLDQLRIGSVTVELDSLQYHHV